MDLVERVKAILITPKTEWPVIATESGDAQYLFTNYVAILAAVPPVAMFLGYAIAGLGVGRALLLAIVAYVLYCVAWYVEGLVIDFLAPSFGGRKDLPSALKLAAYSSTAAWLAGVFYLIPPLAILSIVGLYSIYLLWLGLPALMKSPPERAILYTVAIVVVLVALGFVIVLIRGLLIAPF